MQQYLNLLRHVKDNGTVRPDRTGTGTKSVFGWQMRFDLANGFPLLTTKKLHTRSIIHELLWFIKILFRPQIPIALLDGRYIGGGAGYRPRVRPAYFTLCLSL